MEHVVFFPGPDGAPAFRRVSTLDEAVRFVEHLRNAEGVTEVSVHALTTVPVAFRTYYKVETPGAEAPIEGRSAEAPSEGRSVEAPVAEAPVAEAPKDARTAEVSADGRGADVPAEPAAPAAKRQAADVPAAAEAEVPDKAAELVGAGEAQASAGGKRSLGFFAH